MTGYSEIIQVIGALIIFGLIMTTANRYMLFNTERQVGSEVEVRGAALGQDLIDYSRSIPFDGATENGRVPVNIPGDFAPAPLATSSFSNLEQITNLNGLNGYQEMIQTNVGEFTRSSKVDYLNPSDLNEISGSPSIYKRITVTVENSSISSPITLSYTRVYNNQN